MKTCETCRFWMPTDLDPGQSIDIQYGACIHQKMDYTSDDWTPAEDGTAQTGSDAGWPTWITGPRFGCIHHESTLP
jgi:hypothetical protein